MLGYILYATLSGHGLPAVKFEPFNEAPPNIEFTVTKIPNGYHIKSSDGTNIYQSWEPNIEESWRKSIYGDYWVRNIKSKERRKELDEFVFGEFIWYKNQLWNFAPGEVFMFRQVKGVSRLGKLVENRMWGELGQLSQDVFLHDKPNGGDEAARVIHGATAYPVTDLGDVIARRFDNETDESVTLDITEGEFELCRNDDFRGSFGGVHLFQLPERYDVEDYVSPYYAWDLKSSGKSAKSNLKTPNLWCLLPTPTKSVFFDYRPGCLSGFTLSQYELLLNGESFELMDIAGQVGLDSDCEFQRFDRGRLIITDQNPRSDVEAKQIVGYLSIEGVTPGFTRNR